MATHERRQRCKALCPAKHQCVCEGEDHVLHICSDRNCYCHTAERYAAARQRQMAESSPTNGTEPQEA